METFNQAILYIFSPTPGNSFAYSTALTVLAILLLLSAAGLHVYRKKNREDKVFKKLFRPWPGRLVTLGVLVVLYVLCREMGFPVFSMRLLLFILLAAIVWSVVLMVKSFLNEYPVLKKERSERMERNRYLPRKHKR